MSEIIAILITIIFVGIMIIPKKVEEKPKPQKINKLRTVFTICKSGIVQDRNERYIKLIYQTSELPLKHKSMLSEFGIDSIIRDNVLIVSVKEGNYGY